MADRHDVEWHGVYRGTDDDPREVGYCVTCGREVYDGEGPHTTRRPTEWRALSLTQPWPFIILALGKRTENRPRNIGSHRGPLLLHAAKRMTPDDWSSAFGFVAERFGHRVAERIPPFDSIELVRGAIFARTAVIDQHKPGELWRWGETQERWYMGRHAYLFDSTVVALSKPIPCAGALGFWRPPVSVLTELGLEASDG